MSGHIHGGGCCKTWGLVAVQRLTLCVVHTTVFRVTRFLCSNVQTMQFRRLWLLAPTTLMLFSKSQDAVLAAESGPDDEIEIRLTGLIVVSEIVDSFSWDDNSFEYTVASDTTLTMTSDITYYNVQTYSSPYQLAQVPTFGEIPCALLAWGLRRIYSNKRTHL